MGLGRFCPVGARRAPAAPAHPCARGICESLHIRGRRGSGPLILRGAVGTARWPQHRRPTGMWGGRATPGAVAEMRCRPTPSSPEERREPRVFRAASDRGVISFGDFSLDKQRKVTRPRCTWMCKCRGRQDADSDRCGNRTLLFSRAAALAHPCAPRHSYILYSIARPLMPDPDAGA
jgi:hypothetical protein